MARATDPRAGVVARYAIGSVGTGGFGTLPGLVLLIYMTNTLGVNPAFAGIALTVAKVWDVVIDPWIGAWSDRQLARTGSRRRGMVLGAILLPVFFVLTFAVPPGIGPLASAAWVLVAFLLAATAFSLFQVPYIALPAELSRTYDGRTRLLSARVVVLTLAILAFGGGATELVKVGADEFQGYLIMAAVAAVVFLVAFLVAATSEAAARRGAPGEPAVPAAGAGAGAGGEAAVGGTPVAGSALARAVDAVRGSAPYRALLATFVLQALATGLMLAGAAYVAAEVIRADGVTLLFLALVGPALLVTPLWGALARRVGKERALVVATLLYAAAAASLTLMIWAPGAWVYAPVALCGVAYAGMQSLPLAMLPDAIAHDAATRGPGRAGTFSGVWTAGETAGLALGGTLLAAILAVTGFLPTVGDEVVTQPASAVVGIAVAFSAAPALLLLASLATLARYPLRRRDIDALDGGAA